MKGAELIFAPLGGCREIGMNLNAYAYGPPEDRRWIIVDVGVTFGDDSTPGVDLIMPDPIYLESYADQIEAIILTHAHEDHIGAIAWLWPKLRAPIYATPFTAYLVNEKLRERGLEGQAPLHIMQLQETRKFGPFEVELVTLTHSIPEPNGLAIRTPLGTILQRCPPSSAVIACSSAFAAVVAEAAEVEISTVEKEENIEPAIVRSRPLTTMVLEPALETTAVATPAPSVVASTPWRYMSLATMALAENSTAAISASQRPWRWRVLVICVRRSRGGCTFAWPEPSSRGRRAGVEQTSTLC